MKPRLRVCPMCSDTYDGRLPRCPACAPPPMRPSMGRIRRNRVYADPRWRRVRGVVLRRDNHQCVLCGATELEQRLVVDHAGGIDYQDPFNPDGLRVLCLKCSGRVDGGRSAT